MLYFCAYFRPRTFLRKHALRPAAVGASVVASASLLGASGGDESRVTRHAVQEALTQLDTLVPQLMARTGVPGVAVSVVYRGQTVYAKGFGVRKWGESAGVDADTVFQLASLSKSVGATVMAGNMPGSAGKPVLDWRTPIQSLLPDFQLAYPQPITNARLTLGDLYGHRSGLPDHAGDQLEDLGYARADILQRLRYSALGVYGDYAYTNFGLTAAAQALAQATGTDWATLSQQTLYQPLGMTRTSSRHLDFVNRANRAWGHVQTGVDYHSYGALPAQYQVQNPQRQPDAQSPAGGVSSSAADMARWMALLLQKGQWRGRQLVNADALQQAMTAHPAGKYGYGFNVGPDPQGHASVSHSGAFMLGAHTAFVVWPQAGLGITVLTNAQPRGLAEAIALSFGEHAWADAQDKAPRTDWLPAMQDAMRALYRPEGSRLRDQHPPANAQAAQPLAAYAGRYRNAYYGDAQVAVADDGTALQLTLGPALVQHRLRHWDGDAFAFALELENAPRGSLSAVRFAPDAMTIEYYSQDLARGRFERVSDVLHPHSKQ